MWYLTWMLGTAFACGVAVAVGLWYELHQQRMDDPVDSMPAEKRA